jgi:hypothetical protein
LKAGGTYRASSSSSQAPPAPARAPSCEQCSGGTTSTVDAPSRVRPGLPDRVRSTASTTSSSTGTPSSPRSITENSWSGRSTAATSTEPPPVLFTSHSRRVDRSSWRSRCRGRSRSDTMPRAPCSCSSGPRRSGPLKNASGAAVRETEASTLRRLRKAREELAEAHWYDVQLVNDDFDRCVEEFASVLKSQGCGG